MNKNAIETSRISGICRITIIRCARDELYEENIFRPSRDFNSKQQSSYMSHEDIDSLEKRWEQTIDSVVNASYLDAAGSEEDPEQLPEGSLHQIEIFSAHDMEPNEAVFTLNSDYEMPQNEDNYFLTVL